MYKSLNWERWTQIRNRGFSLTFRAWPSVQRRICGMLYTPCWALVKKICSFFSYKEGYWKKRYRLSNRYIAISAEFCQLLVHKSHEKQQTLAKKQQIKHVIIIDIVDIKTRFDHVRSVKMYIWVPIYIYIYVSSYMYHISFFKDLVSEIFCLSLQESEEVRFGSLSGKCWTSWKTELCKAVRYHPDYWKEDIRCHEIM